MGLFAVYRCIFYTEHLTKRCAMDYPETVGTKLQVYMNIRRYKQGVPFWSLRNKKTNIVVGHASALVLEDCSFTVQPAGQSKVRKTKRKNVHAWITGTRTDANPMSMVEEYGLVPSLRTALHEITYNPYKHDRFVIKDFWASTQEVTWARKVIFHPAGSVYIFAPPSKEWVAVNHGVE